MSRSGFRTGLGPTCAAGLLAGGALLASALPAAAQLSAETLWEDWQSAYTGFGGTLTAEDESYADGVLTLSGVSIASEVEGAESTTTLGDLTLRERADGTVAVEVPPVIAMSSASTVQGPDGEETVEVEVEVTQNEFEMVVSEQEGARRYVYAATSMIANVETPGTSEGGSGTVSVAARGLEGVTAIADGRFEQTQAAESMTFQSFAANPGGQEGGTTVRYQMTGMTGEASGAMPAPRAAGGEPLTLSEMQLDAAGTLRHGGSLIEIDVDGPQPATVQGGSEAGGVEFALGPESLSYALVSEGTSMEVVTGALPMPIPFDLGSSRTEIQLPLGGGGGDGPSPFGAVLALRDLSLGEAVWGMFDPSGQLPRDPITVVLDIDGTATMNADLFGDPAALAELQGPPGRPETLDVSELLVRFGGAELRGEGSMTFDEAMTPVGTVELALDGGMALLDRLVALGVVPQEQMMGVRAMLGVVAQPVGEDSLRSTIEFTEDGGVLANGMQVR
jgi:hypothetical protein